MNRYLIDDNKNLVEYDPFSSQIMCVFSVDNNSNHYVISGSSGDYVLSDLDVGEFNYIWLSLGVNSTNPRYALAPETGEYEFQTYPSEFDKVCHVGSNYEFPAGFNLLPTEWTNSNDLDNRRVHKYLGVSSMSSYFDAYIFYRRIG